MLPRQNRLTKRKDYQKVLCSKESWKSEGFLIKKKSLPANRCPCLGIIVSTKVSKSAVKRNLIKRRLREIVKDILPKLPFYDIAIIALPPSVGLSFAQTKKEIIVLLNKSKILPI